MCTAVRFPSLVIQHETSPAGAPLLQRRSSGSVPVPARVLVSRHHPPCMPCVRLARAYVYMYKTQTNYVREIASVFRDYFMHISRFQIDRGFPIGCARRNIGSATQSPLLVRVCNRHDSRITVFLPRPVIILLFFFYPTLHNAIDWLQHSIHEIV